MTVLFVPVSLYKVKFQVAAGRPFSRFERLLLKAVESGVTELNTLVGLFSVHRRMVVEALVTLMQAGWVSIGSEASQFSLTPAGAEASHKHGAVPATVFTEDRWQIVVMERVFGQVARSDKVRTETKRALSKIWHSAVRISKSDISNTVEPGIVKELLSYRSGERVRWVGPITTASDSNAFVVVGVDTANERIIGIPQSWKPLLADTLLNRARRRERELLESGQSVDNREAEDFVTPTTDSGLFEQDAHYDIDLKDISVAHDDVKNLDLFKHFLDRSRSFIVVASSSLDVTTIERLRSFFEAALLQGKSIYVSWGRTTENGESTGHRDGLRLLEKMQWDSRRNSASGKLFVANSEGQFRANVILGDLDGFVEGAFGSYSWLGAKQDHTLSVHVRHPGLISRLCDILGDYHDSDARLRRSSGLTRLRNAAVELSVAADALRGEPGNAKIALVLDLFNDVEFKGAVLAARQSATLSAFHFGNDFESGVWTVVTSALHQNQGMTIEVEYPKGSRAPTRPGNTEFDRVSFKETEACYRNVLRVDDSLLLLTNHPFNGADRPNRRSFGSEIGVKIWGTKLDASWLAQLTAPHR